jgi:hypothetical protein
MRMPVDDLISNWAYMVMSALAWNIKSWYGLLMPNRQRGLELVRMEYCRSNSSGNSRSKTTRRLLKLGPTENSTRVNGGIPGKH